MAPKVGNVYLIAAIAVIGGMLFGFDISSMSAFVDEQPYLCKFNTLGMNEDTGECNGPSANVQGGITAAMPGGSWLGALFSGYLSDNLGRKVSIQIACVIWVIGSILCCAAQDIPMLIVGRVINGICVGIASSQVPVYISEISPPSVRGRLIGFQQWSITWGILIMFFICYGCSFIESTASFRIPWGVQMVPAILLGTALFILPESPRWLAKQDRWEESLEVLVLVHGHGDANSPFVHQEMEEIRQVVEADRQNADVTYLELFKPHMINRTLIGIFMQIWSQLCGQVDDLSPLLLSFGTLNVMMYYIVYIFSMAGIGNGTLVSSGIDYVINVCTTVPALIWMDKWGRRPTLLVGAFFMCLWMCCNAGLFAVYSRPAYSGEFNSNAESMSISGPPAKAVIACTYLFVASYAPTWGPTSWTYPAELYPLRVRGKAVALSTSANWAFNFALAYFVPVAFAQITWKTYVIFAVFCFTMFWHVFFLFPETANKTLEEVADIFDDTKPGATKYIGQLAWTTRNERHAVQRLERGDVESKQLHLPSNEHLDNTSHNAEPKV